MNTSDDTNNKINPIQPFHWERHGLHTRWMMNQGMACKSLCWEFSKERMSPGLTCMPPSSSSMMYWPAPGTKSMRTPTIWLQKIPKISICIRQTSSKIRIKFQHLNATHLVLQLPLPNPLKPGDKSRIDVQLEQHRQAMLQLHLSDQQFYCPLRYPLY